MQLSSLFQLNLIKKQVMSSLKNDFKILFICFVILITYNVNSVEQEEKANPQIILKPEIKEYGSPIKRWAGDAKCKLKRFFGSNC